MDHIFEALQDWASRFPASIALASRTSYMTYEDFVGNISSALRAATKSGIKPGQLVVLTGANADAQLIIALALLRIGCRVGYDRDLTLYDASGVAVDAVIADAPIRGVKHRVIVIGANWFRGADAIGVALPAPAADYSMIYSSSGSTGRPKLVENPPLLHKISIDITQAELQDRPRYLSAFGNRTDATFYDSLATLSKGGMVIRATTRSGAGVLDAIQLLRPNYVLMAPSMLVDLFHHLDDKPMALSRISLMRTAGAYCAPDVQNAVVERIAERFMSSYGSVEMGWIAWGYGEDIQKTERSVGRVVEGMEVAAFGEDDRKLPPGTEGQIRAKGPDGAAGFYIGENSPQQQIFKDGWFVTGDLGMVDADQNLIIRGRFSNVINFGGSKVSPELLEEEIRSFSQVRDVGIVGLDQPQGYEQICAAIVSNSKMKVGDINAHLHRRNAHWPVHQVKNVPAIPKTESGKIDRVALKRLCLTQA